MNPKQLSGFGFGVSAIGTANYPLLPLLQARGCGGLGPLRLHGDEYGAALIRVGELVPKGLAIRLGEGYERSMLTDGGKTPPGTQRLVDKSHRSCGANRWQRPADAATAFTTNT